MKNEYTIFDYLKVILRGKFIVIGVMFVALFFGSLFLSFSSALYEGSLTLMVENPDDLLETAKSEIKYSEMEVEVIEENIVLKSKGESEEEVEGSLKEYFLRIKESYEEMLSEKQEEKERRIKLQRKTIESLENHMDYLEAQASALGEMAMRDRDVSSVFFFFTAKENAESVRRELLQENHRLEDMQREKEEIQKIKAGDVSVSEESPQPEKTFLLALVLGLIGGILVVLFKDWWENENAV